MFEGLRDIGDFPFLWSTGEPARPCSSSPAQDVTASAASHVGRSVTMKAEEGQWQLVEGEEDFERFEAVGNVVVDAVPWHDTAGAVAAGLPEPLRLRQLQEAQRSARAEAVAGGQDWPAFAAARIISLSGAKGRRVAMQRCLAQLCAIGVDCSFHDAVDGRALGLTEDQLRGGVHRLHAGGREVTVDTSAWPEEGWTADMLAEVEQRFRKLRFSRHFWPAIRQNVQDPQSLGFVGGHLSHAAVWREARQNGWDWVLVLEDDALPAPSLGLTWADIWRVVAREIAELKRRGEQWDILYVGRTLSMTPEGRAVSELLCEPGYCLRTHSYCLSHRGYSRLLNSGIATTVLHCPQDEVLATLCIQDHVHGPAWEKIADIRPKTGWRALAVRWRGLTAQLIDVERSERAASQVQHGGPC